jgi:ABC-type glycerol-3-phosphate transport system substrate-binding protein
LDGKKSLRRRNLLRIGLLGGAGAVGFAALAGCGEAEIVEVIKEVEVEKVVTVEVEKPAPQAVDLVMFDYVWVEIDQVRDLIVDNYKSINPHVNLEYIKIPWGDYLVKILTSIAGGSPGDVVYNHPQTTSDMAAKGALMPLNEFIKSDKGFDVEDFNDGLIEANTIGGKIYSLPTFSGPLMWAYNRDMIEPLGMGDPWELAKKGEWTSDMHGQMARAAVGGTGQDKVFGSSEIWSALKISYLWVWGHDGTYWDSQAAPKEFVGNSPEAVSALEYMSEMLKDGTIPPREFSSNFPGGSQAMLFSNKIALYMSHRQFFREITDQINAGLAPMYKMPNGDDQSRDAPEGYGVYSGTKEPDEAWNLAKYIGTEGVKVHIALGYSGPTRPSLWRSDIFKNSLKPWEDIEVYIHAFETLKNQFVMPVGYGEMNTLFTAAYDEIVLGNKTAQQSMDDVKPKIDAILAENA